jgi:hypothetical protein
MNRILWTVDYKSSKDIYEEYRIQSAVYAGIYEATDETHILPRAGVLRLDKETGEPHFEDVSEGMEERYKAFLALREYYRHSHFSEPKKGYKLNGKIIPSVTTILGVLDKPALMVWSANMAVEYIEANLKEMNTPEQIEYHLKKAKTAFRTASQKAKDTGSIVHDAIHAHLSGAKPEPILEGNDKAINSFLAFLEWAKNVKLEVVALEKVLIHPTLEFGGTCDFIGWLDI